jgi:hypothetical protein
MMQFAVILMILPILISINSFGSSGLLLQNTSEDINHLFSNLTPDNLGVKEYSNQSNSIYSLQKDLPESERGS